MLLFRMKKEKAKTATCTCNGGCSESEAAEIKVTAGCCKKMDAGICCIKVLGSGCKNCHALFEATNEAVKSIGLNIEVEYVTDMHKMLEYGVMSTPALVVNNQVASMGRVLKATDVEKILKQFNA